MLTKTAAEDLKALRAAGHVPTDEDVVALNDLALRIERGRDTTPANHPRTAFAGDVALHEPTVGALEWWLDFGRDAALTAAGRTETYFFMFANARRVDWLRTLDEPKKVRAAVREWKKGVNATEAELWRAVWWCKWGDGEPPEDGAELGDEEVKNALWDTVLAAAGALQKAPEELRHETQSALRDAVMRVNVRAGLRMKQSVARDYVAYREKLREIEARKHG